MSEHQIAGRVTFDGRIANNDICAKCEEVWPCDFTQARMQRDALRTALTAAQAAIAQLEAQVAELTAALEELTDTWHDTIHGVEESLEIMQACQIDPCRSARAALAAIQEPRGEGV